MRTILYGADGTPMRRRIGFVSGFDPHKRERRPEVECCGYITIHPEEDDNESSQEKDPCVPRKRRNR